MNISELFCEFIEKDEHYKKAFEIVRKNARGKIWLIGGTISRNLDVIINKNKGSVQDVFDFDFVVEELASESFVPDGWEFKINKFGSPKIFQNNFFIDIMPLSDIYAIKNRGWEPTIENFLLQTPFTIQSLVYDTETKEVFGDLGLDALKAREFCINDLDQAKVYASKKDIDLNVLIEKMAKSMNFTPVFVEGEN